jgi:hypothetical protein
MATKSDTSFFINDDDKSDLDDKDKKPDTISEKSSDDEELVPDQPNKND